MPKAGQCVCHDTLPWLISFSLDRSAQFAMKHALLGLVAATLVSCAMPSSTTAPIAAAVRGSGSSYATAIIVPATNEMAGVQWEEYAYIRSHYPGPEIHVPGSILTAASHMTL